MMTVLEATLVIVVLLAGGGGATIEDHCTDISYWDVLEYETVAKQCCHTKLHQVCTNNKDQVCADVLELQCEIVAWGECTSTPTTTQSKKCRVEFKDYAHQNCEEVKTSMKHNKKIPDCKQVTRFDCVTDWQIDAEGNKEWSGNETCNPVTWEECQIVEKELVFPTIKTECNTDSNIKWADFVEVSKESNGFNTTCQVKKAVNCENVFVNKCAPVEWLECRMEPVEECKAVVIHSPAQRKRHRKTCLTSEPKITPSEPSQNVEPEGIEKKAGGNSEPPKITPSEPSQNVEPEGSEKKAGGNSEPPKITPSEPSQIVEPKGIERNPGGNSEPPKITPSEPNQNVEPQSIEKDLGKILKLGLSDTPNEPDKVEPVREAEILGTERICFDVCAPGLVPSACFCKEPEGSGGTMCAPQEDCTPSGICTDIKEG